MDSGLRFAPPGTAAYLMQIVVPYTSHRTKAFAADGCRTVSVIASAAKQSRGT
jgi:hypothetical protein